MSGWKTDSILAEQRQKWQTDTADWSADELREKLAQLSAATYPFWYVLSHLIDNPDRPYGGMTVVSDLWPYHTTELDNADDTPETYGAKYDGKAHAWRAVPIVWNEPKRDRFEHDEVHFDGGVTLHESFTLLSIWQFATAASINCGSIDTDDVRRLVAAFNREKTP